MTIQEARKVAMEFPGTVELPHFEKTSFRAPKKIFMTMDESTSTAVVTLSLEEQSLFSRSPDGAISPVPNKWGAQGWTRIDLKKVKKTLFKDVVKSSWMRVASKKLIAEYEGTR